MKSLNYDYSEKGDKAKVSGEQKLLLEIIFETKKLYQSIKNKGF
jgi:hypothetical protein